MFTQKQIAEINAAKHAVEALNDGVFYDWNEKMRYETFQEVVSLAIDVLSGQSIDQKRAKGLVLCTLKEMTENMVKELRLQVENN